MGRYKKRKSSVQNNRSYSRETMPVRPDIDRIRCECGGDLEETIIGIIQIFI